jgi:hypothetical protein
MLRCLPIDFLNLNGLWPIKFKLCNSNPLFQCDYLFSNVREICPGIYVHNAPDRIAAIADHLVPKRLAHIAMRTIRALIIFSYL